VWRNAVQKFSSSGSGFDPSFSKTEKVRVVEVRAGEQRAERVGRLGRNAVGVPSGSSSITEDGNLYQQVRASTEGCAGVRHGAAT